MHQHSTAKLCTSASSTGGCSDRPAAASVASIPSNSATFVCFTTSNACIHDVHEKLNKKDQAFVTTTFFFERRAQDSIASAASSFPWRRYKALRFFNVVLTLGLTEYNNDHSYKTTQLTLSWLYIRYSPFHFHCFVPPTILCIRCWSLTP